jgi:cytochrome P450
MVEYEPFEARWREDPYPVYRQLRDESPVHWAPRSKVWCVSRYEDALEVLKQTETFSSRAMFSVLMNGGSEEMPPLRWTAVKMLTRYAWRTRMNPLGFPTARNLIVEDPPVHDALRSIVNRGFSPRRIESWEPRIRELVDELLAGLRGGGRFDLVRDFAIPLPVTIIAEMLGVEPERMRDFKSWSDTVISGMTGPKRTTAPDPPHPEVWDAIVELNAYLAKVVRRRKQAPADDVISVVLAQRGGDVALTTLEVVQFVQILLVAGNETTTNLIGNAVQALLDHPEVLRRAVGDPALVPALVEETLRFDAPIQLVFRTALRDTEIAGTRIPAGSTVAPILGSANRDERRFPDPDRFDPAREARGHLGFGFGTHFCLGASLARLEGRAALEALVPELPRLAAPATRPERLDSFLVRGPARMELRSAA